MKLVIFSLYTVGCIDFGVLSLLLIKYSVVRPANLQSQVGKGKMSQEKFEKTMTLLKGVLDYESFKDVDLVIEVICLGFDVTCSFPNMHYDVKNDHFSCF